MENKVITLYKLAKTGKTVQWSIYLDGDRFRTEDGEVGGKLTMSEYTVCTGKNIGRSNETSPAEQAYSEVLSKVQKKKDSGYTQDASNAGRQEIDPMLAKSWKDYKDKIPDGTWFVMEPKLDGMRAVTNKDGMFSRGGKPIVAVPHLVILAKMLLTHFPEGTFLDGELYNHDYKNDFNKLISVFKKQKPTAEDLKESEKIAQYHIYDVCIPGSDLGADDRWLLIRSAIKQCGLLDIDCIQLISMTQVCWQSDIEMFHGMFMEQGYEGSMLRIQKAPYEKGRTKNLLKMKEFQDDEFQILGFEEGAGNRSGMAGFVIVNVPGYGRCGAGIKGGVEFYKQLWKDKDTLVGAMANIRFQNYTPDGGLRCPVLHSIRDYE